jgi:hypothetical protein
MFTRLLITVFRCLCIASNNSPAGFTQANSGALRGRCGAPCTDMCVIHRNDNDDNDDNGDNTGVIIA